MFKQTVKDDIRIGIPAQLNTDSHTGTVRFIPYFCNTVYFFIFYKLCNLLNESRFIDHVRKLGNHNSLFSVGHRLDIRNGTDFNLSASRPVCLADARFS